MFISSRGLRVLVDMADENYEEQKNLVWMAVDGILRVLEIQVSQTFTQHLDPSSSACTKGPTPRHDFCRIFAHHGLLPALAVALHHTIADADELAEDAKCKIVNIFFLFAQSDLKMREALAIRAVITSALSIFDHRLHIKASERI